MSTPELYLDICSECKTRHGYIVCADGTRSGEFATEKRATQELARLSLRQHVTDEEVKIGLHKICLAGLVTSDKELDAFLDAMNRERTEHINIFDAIDESDALDKQIERFEGLGPQPDKAPQRTLH